jgi:hypothetical protein
MSMADILAQMEQAQVEKTILMSAQSIQYDFVAGNAKLAEAIAPHPQLYGYVYINMHYPERSLREMEKYLGTDKFVGVKYNGEYSRSAACAPENKDVFTLLERSYRKPLLLHTWGLPEHGNVVAYEPARAGYGAGSCPPPIEDRYGTHGGHRVDVGYTRGGKGSQSLPGHLCLVC